MQVRNKLEVDTKQQTGSKSRKEYIKAELLSPCLFNVYAEYIMRNAGLDDAQAGIMISGRNINNLRHADDTPPYGRTRRRTKEPLDESKRVKVKKLA